MPRPDITLAIALVIGTGRHDVTHLHDAGTIKCPPRCKSLPRLGLVQGRTRQATKTPKISFVVNKSSKINVLMKKKKR